MIKRHIYGAECAENFNWGNSLEFYRFLANFLKFYLIDLKEFIKKSRWFKIQKKTKPQVTPRCSNPEPHTFGSNIS